MSPEALRSVNGARELLAPRLAAVVEESPPLELRLRVPLDRLDAGSRGTD